MKKIWYIAGAVALLGLLAFGYYALSPLFIRVELDESAPQGVAASEQAGAPVMGTPAHPASGTVRVVEADGKRYVRYEDFKTINGPDLYVYLASDMDATEFIDLGRIRATEGNVNYEIPAGVDLDEYPYVLVWCKAFGVLFNSAHIQAM